MKKLLAADAAETIILNIFLSPLAHALSFHQRWGKRFHDFPSQKIMKKTLRPLFTPLNSEGPFNRGELERSGREIKKNNLS